jgi:cell division protein FtsQ
MNRRLKILLAVAAVCVFFAVTALAYVHAVENRRMTACNALEIVFKDSLKFVTEEDIRSYLSRDYGSFIGERLDSVRLWKMEEILRSKSAVNDCEAWVTDDGIVHVAITQRAPAVRFEKDGYGFYADSRGCIFPLHKSYTADVPVVSGAVPLNAGASYKGEPKTGREREWLRGVIALLDWIDASRTWKGKVTGMSVNEAGDLVLTLDGMGEKFIFGRPDKFDYKFSQVEKYRSYILPANEGKPYKSVNLKYNKQIICRKDI